MSETRHRLVTAALLLAVGVLATALVILTDVALLIVA